MKILTTILIGLNTALLIAQDHRTNEIRRMIMEFCATEAQYPGGRIHMENYFTSNMNYPEECLKKGIEGTVWTHFTVEKDGSITNIEIFRGVNFLLDKEAIRLIKEMPNWDSASMSGKGNMITRVRLPVTFEIRN